CPTVWSRNWPCLVPRASEGGVDGGIVAEIGGDDMLWYGEFTWHPQTMPRRCDGASSNRTSPTLALRKGSEAGNPRSRPLRRRTKGGQAWGVGSSRAQTNID